jgi:hypothetical protein
MSAAHGEQLPAAPVVKEWTAVEVLGFIQERNILENDENRKALEKVEICGNSFLSGGDSINFWRDGCGLPFGPSYMLARLVEEIKGIKSQGNAFQCFSDITGSV